MINHKQALQDLRDKVAAGDGMGAGIIAKSMASAARDAGRLFPAHDIHKAFYGSLDAAKALHDAVLPDVRWLIKFNGDVKLTDGHKMHKATAETTSRAWLLSILDALITKEETP